MSNGSEPYTEVRPWGEFTVLLDSADCKVKRITVNAGKRLSLQRHDKREEHWIIVAGQGIVTLGDTVDDLEEDMVGPGDRVWISKREIHRIEARRTDLVFIEVQLGDSFEESDIERFEDDFGRS